MKYNYSKHISNTSFNSQCLIQSVFKIKNYYEAVENIAFPGLAGLAGSTESLTPPPSLNGHNPGLFNPVNCLALLADKTLALGQKIFPDTKLQPLGQTP